MKRETKKYESQNNKNIWYIGGSVLAIGIIAFAITFIVYGNKMEVQQSQFDTGRFADLVQNTTTNTNTQTASSQMGKTVQEAQNTTNTANITKNNASANTATQEEPVKKTQEKKSEEKPVAEIKFVKPVEGEIAKGFAKDNLIYSETLQEWTTHLGIDIKAEKTTVVKASADGKVKSIKNDPRYGLSVILEHQNGYETLYANLLTSEFVQVGEEVKQGQSIGTVGNTAVFEIADTAHLHFEITQNKTMIDPTTVLQ